MKSPRLFALLFASLVVVSICEHHFQLNIEDENSALALQQNTNSLFFNLGDLNTDQLYRASSGVSLTSDDGYAICKFAPEHIVKSYTEVRTTTQFNLYLHTFYKKTSPPDLPILFRSILV